MGNQIDCFYNFRQCHQCCFPCIRTCTYSNKRVWYNFDGMESIQPLIAIYQPKSGTRITKFPQVLEKLHEDNDIASQLNNGGLDPPEQLAAICKFASEQGYHVRAVGSGSSWSQLTHTKDILIDMRGLNRILSKREVPDSASSSHDIEVEGGKLVVDFVKDLDENFDLGLKMIGNYAGQTVAGVANTSTHGSGYRTGTLSNHVAGVHLITSGGIQVRVREGEDTIDKCAEDVENATYGDPPVEVNSTEVLKAVAVGLGSMGIIYSITYHCVPVYNIEENRVITNILWNGKDDFKIREKMQGLFDGQDEMPEYFSFFINPHPLKIQGGRHLNIAYVTGEHIEASNYVCPAACSWWCGPGGRGIADISCMQTDCTAACLQGCAQCCPTCIPSITNFGLSQFSLRYPYKQKWYNVLQFTKGNIHVRTAEWCLPLDNLNEALGDVIELAQHYAKEYHQYSLLPIYVRFAKSDELYLSPANKRRPPKVDQCDYQTCDTYCYIEVPFLPGAYGTDEFQALVEDKLVSKYQARPHWGKNNRLNKDKLADVYHAENVKKWKEVRRVFDKQGTFDNYFTEDVGLDVLITEQPK